MPWRQLVDTDCRVRLMEKRDLSTVLSWRNHSDVRRFMLSQHEITLEEHAAWFERASQDPSRCLLMVEQNGFAFGFVHFSNITHAGLCDWGFYAAPNAPKGSGRKLGLAALSHAFNSLGRHKVCGQALCYNTASIKFHERLGFCREGVLRQQALIESEYFDVICFGLLEKEWKMQSLASHPNTQ